MDQQHAMLETLSTKIDRIAERAPARQPTTTTETATHIVKEKSSSENVVRAKVTLREEGLEWSVGQSSGSTVRKQLSPE